MAAERPTRVYCVHCGGPEGFIYGTDKPRVCCQYCYNHMASLRLGVATSHDNFADAMMAIGLRVQMWDKHYCDRALLGLKREKIIEQCTDEERAGN